MVEIISFFSWRTYARDSVYKRTRMLKQPRLARIVPLLTKQKMTVDAVLGNNEDYLQKKIMKNSWLIVK